MPHILTTTKRLAEFQEKMKDPRFIEKLLSGRIEHKIGKLTTTTPMAPKS